MLISGEWFPCPDDILRPVVSGEVLSGVGNWIPVPFLLDTEADRTVLAADVFLNLGLLTDNAQERISGLGGLVDSVVIETKIKLMRETAAPVLFSGRFAAVTDATALDQRARPGRHRQFRGDRRSSTRRRLLGESAARLYYLASMKRAT